MLRRSHGSTQHPRCRCRERKIVQATHPSAHFIDRSLPGRVLSGSTPPINQQWPEAVPCTRTSTFWSHCRCTVSSQKNKIPGPPVVSLPCALAHESPLPIHVSCYSVSSKLLAPRQARSPPIVAPLPPHPSLKPYPNEALRVPHNLASRLRHKGSAPFLDGHWK